MNNVLLLHIGRPKTGTTALQAFLYENRQILNEYGWCYPDLNEEFKDIGIFNIREKNGYLFHKILEEIDTLDEHWNSLWDSVLKHLEKKNVIISAEGFWNVAQKFFVDAKEKYNNIKVIVYLRRQDKVLESMYNQRIKAGHGCERTIQEYIHNHEEVLRMRLDYVKKLDEISRIIGKENVIVRVYEQQQLCGERHDVISDFLSVLGIEPNWNQWKDCPTIKKNSRLYGNYLEIRRVLNSLWLAKNMESQLYMGIFQELAWIFGKKDTAEEEYLTPEEREIILAEVESKNEKIAKEYLHRADGVLFYDNETEHGVQSEIYHCSSFEEDMIRIFFAVLCRQNEEMKVGFSRLKALNGILVNKWLLGNMRDRSLLLFGAGNKCRELLGAVELPVKWIVDNDVQRRGETIYERRIVHPNDIDDWSEYFVCVTCVDTGEIEVQLQELGLIKEEDYICVQEYFI